MVVYSYVLNIMCVHNNIHRIYIYYIDGIEQFFYTYIACIEGGETKNNIIIAINAKRNED